MGTREALGGKRCPGGQLKRYGRGPIQVLLAQSAKKLLLVDNPLQQWSLCVAARVQPGGGGRGAQARRGCVARADGSRHRRAQSLARLQAKLFKLATEIGVPAIKAAGHASKAAFIGEKALPTQKLPLTKLTTCLQRVVRLRVRMARSEGVMGAWSDPAQIRVV